MSEKLKLLADENIGGDILENIIEALKDLAEITELPDDMRGKPDEEVLDYAKEKSFDGVLSMDDNFIKSAIMKQLKAFWVIPYKDHTTIIICEVKPIKGFRKIVKFFDFNED